mgnify:CR=1 FL=1
MPELRIIEFAELSPTNCAICSGTNGPFLDTARDIQGYGRIHLCVGTEDRPGCLIQAVRLLGVADQALKNELELRAQQAAREAGLLRGRADLATQVFELVTANYQPEPELDEHQDYEDMTVDDLQQIAASLDIEGRSSMKKADLIRAIEKER